MVGGIDHGRTQARKTAGGMTFEEAWVLYQEAMKKKGRSQATLTDYQFQDDSICGLARPAAGGSRRRCAEAPQQDRRGRAAPTWLTARCGFCGRSGAGHGASIADCRRAPTANVDFYPETGRTAVITDWPAWWDGVQQIANPVRRDFYIWLAFSGCRAGETMRMEVKHVDLENGIAEVSDHQDHGVRDAAERLHDRVAAQSDRRERRRIRRGLSMGVSVDHQQRPVTSRKRS